MSAPASEEQKKNWRDYTKSRLVRAAGKPMPIAPEDMLLWSYEQLASKTNMPIGTLRRMVSAGKGPKMIKIGRHHRFMPADVNMWITELQSDKKVTS